MAVAAGQRHAMPHLERSVCLWGNTAPARKIVSGHQQQRCRAVQPHLRLSAASCQPEQQAFRSRAIVSSLRPNAPALRSSCTGRQPGLVTAAAAQDTLPGSDQLAAGGQADSKATVDLLWARLWYLSTSGAVVMILPYLNLFYQNELGFTSAQIGLLAALKPWVAAPCGNVWASVADSTKKHRMILIAAWIISTCTRSSMMLPASFAAQLVLSLVTEVFASPVPILADAAVMASVSNESDYGKQRMFGAIGWGGFSIVAGAVTGRFGLRSGFVAYFIASIIALGPTVMLPLQVLSQPAKTQQDAEKNSGGRPLQNNAQPFNLRQRRQGAVVGSSSVDAGSSAGLAGRLQQPMVSLYQTLEEEWDSWAGSEGARPARQQTSALLVKTAQHQSWDISAIRHPLADVAPPAMPGLLSLEEDDDDLPQQGLDFKRKADGMSFWQGCKVLLSDAEVCVFFVKTTLMGIATGAISSYLFMYLGRLGGSESLMGLTLMVNCIAEAPLFFYAGRVIERLGVKRVINISLATYVLRMAAYAALPLFPSPWFVLPVELLHGITFGCSWAAGTVHCSRISPPGLKSTTQAIFSSLYFGVGAGIGALAGGQLFDSVGPQALFAALAGTVLAGWLACMAFESALPRRVPLGVTLRTIDE